jgi:competence protein ComEC
MRRPLVGAAVGLAIGASIGLHGAPFPPLAHAALALALAPPLAPLAFAAAGWRAAEAAATRGRPAAEARTVLTGSVATVPERTEDLLRFRLRTAAGEALDVLAPPSPWPLALGDRIRLDASLREPPAARNPGGRDARARLAASGVALQAVATAPAVRLAPPSAAALLERARERLAAAAARALPAREAGLVRAIGSGDRGGVDPETTRSFARSGLAHVLAVSGLHLVVVAFGLERLLRALFVRLDAVAARVDPRRLAAALALPWTLAYAVATGAGVPVLRAALAAGAALLGTLLDREADALQTLALAALVLLAADPGSALDPSLQLSFAAVGGLALWARPLRRRVPLARAPRGTWRARLGEPLLAGACASLAATAATAPVLAFHFRQLPTLGVLANLAGVPLGSALTVLATVAGLLAALSPPLAVPVLVVARPLATALLALSDATAAPAWAVVGVGTPGLAGALASYGAALVATRSRGLARAAAWAAAAAALLLPADLRARAARLRGGLEVTFVSVGQGDAALLRLPDGGAVLVDAGGAAHGGADPGARDVVPLLRDLGVRRLAAVFVSHPHPDHVLGLAAVADALPIDAAFSNGEPGDGASDAVLARLAARPLLPGDGWARAGVSFDVLGGDRVALGPNDASLVLRVRYGETVFLFPGDVEARGEAAAVLRGGLAADVVKIPHHGSRTSSTRAFVEAVRPRYAIACVGAANRYGFPHGEVLERWRGVGASVHRTDEGAIRFVSDGRTIRRVPASDALDPLAILRERA